MMADNFFTTVYFSTETIETSTTINESKVIIGFCSSAIVAEVTKEKKLLNNMRSQVLYDSLG